MEQILRKFLADLIRWATRPPDQPGLFKLKVKGETFTVTGQSYSEMGETVEVHKGIVMPKNITDIVLPPLNGNPKSVTTRRFRIDTTGETPTSVFGPSDFTVDLTNPDVEIVVPDVLLSHGVEIKLSLIDLDAAGNESLPREFITTPSDVTPPDQPGEFQMRVKGEQPD